MLDLEDGFFFFVPSFHGLATVVDDAERSAIADRKGGSANKSQPTGSPGESRHPYSQTGLREMSD
jgi:hypothetical protein